MNKASKGQIIYLDNKVNLTKKCPIYKTQDIIYETLNYTPTNFRPTYGSINNINLKSQTQSKNKKERKKKGRLV